jgi:hypothetical protein
MLRFRLVCGGVLLLFASSQSHINNGYVEQYLEKKTTSDVKNMKQGQMVKRAGCLSRSV